MRFLTRPSTYVWLTGLILLAATAVGTNWLLNHSNAADGNTPANTENKNDTVAFSPFGAEGITGLGYVDVEPGVAALYPAQLGRVVWVEDEGKNVKKGEVILRVDDRLQQKKLEEAKIALAVAEKKLEEAQLRPKQLATQIAQLEASIDSLTHKKEAARQILLREEELLEANVGSKHKRAAAEETVKEIDSMIQAQKAKIDEVKVANPEIDIKQAEFNRDHKLVLLDEAKLAIDECTINAPSDGTVLRVFAHVGEVLGPNPRMPAIQFCPKMPRIVRAEIQQEWASQLAVGQPVVLTDDTTHAHRWEGRVKRLSDWYTHRRSQIQEPFQFNDIRTMEAIIEVTEPEGRPLRIGQRMRVSIKQGGP